jgi:glutathione S-transferase
MKLWGRLTSFNVQKVTWLLGELGLKPEYTQVGGRFGGLDDSAFLAMNPHGKVPVLEDNGLVLMESHTILRYLAAEHGGNAWWPASARDRSGVDRWLDWGATWHQPHFMGLFWGYYREPQASRNHQANDRFRRSCEADYALLDRELSERPYLNGDEFSLADVPAGATLYRYFGMGLDVPQPDNVMRWYERLQARPAYREHIMTSFEELHARSDF